MDIGDIYVTYSLWPTLSLWNSSTCFYKKKKNQFINIALFPPAFCPLFLELMDLFSGWLKVTQMPRTLRIRAGLRGTPTPSSSFPILCILRCTEVRGQLVSCVPRWQRAAAHPVWVLGLYEDWTSALSWQLLCLPHHLIYI